jgi:nitrate reductase molybdenum cofactor assembly chaperone NarJ/NarW
MRIFKLLSALLLYPEQELLDALPQLHLELAAISKGEAHYADLPDGTSYAKLGPLLNYLYKHDLITLQQNYVQTFDRNHSHSLFLFEHIHGESRDRGQAMVDLLGEYQKAGWEMTSDNLPDYVPLFLEFLSTLEDPADSSRLLGDAIHVMAHVGNKLQANGSPYACVFGVLEDLSPVTAETLSEPPVRDMDEALETFGPSAEGVEPLLNPGLAVGGIPGTHPITFYPKSAPTAGRTVRSA